MVEDVLVLDQGFVDLVLHPRVKSILNRYLGRQYELTEAKGWKSLPTKRDFHGWHGDAWYEQTVPRRFTKKLSWRFICQTFAAAPSITSKALIAGSIRAW